MIINLVLLVLGVLPLVFLDRSVVSLGLEAKDSEPLLGVSDNASR